MWILLFISFLFTPSAHAASVTQIIGMSADRGVIPPPSGLCGTGKTFNMIQSGILSMTEATAIQFFDIGPLEDTYDGNGYFLINNAANTNTLYRITLSSFVVAGTTITDAANIPDTSNTQIASHYNPFTASWVQSGHQNSAPCNVAVNDCIHIRTYPGGTLVVDVRPGIGQIVNQARQVTFDATRTYFTYDQSSGVPGFYLGSFQTGIYGFVESVFTDAVVQYAALTNDASFVYALRGNGVIHRFQKTNLAAGPTVFTPGLAGGTSTDITYNLSTNQFFVTVLSGGASPNLLYKLNGTTLAIEGSTSLLNTQFANRVLLDSVNNKVYVGTSPGGTGGGLARVNMSTMGLEASFSTVSTPNGPNVWRIDVPHQKAYIAFSGGGGAQSQLQQVSLCN